MAAINLVVTQEAQKQVDELQKKLEKIEQQLITISNTGLGKKAGFIDVKTQRELTEALQLQKDTAKELGVIKDELAKTQDKLNKSNQKELTEYEKLNKEYQANIKAYNDLIAKKVRAGKLTDEEAKRLEKLGATLKKTRAEFVQIGAAQKSVGITANKSKAQFDSLGFSVAQLTRESPAFLNSVNTGFMAISNNIPIFVDEITKLRDANAGLIAQGKPTKNVFKEVMRAVFSWQSAISLGIVALTVLGPKIAELAEVLFKTEQRLDQTTEAQKEFNKSLLDGEKAAQKEITQLNLLNQIVQSERVSMDRRKGALQELRETHGKYLKDLTDEEILMNGVSSAMDKLSESIVKQAKARVLIKELTELSEKQVELERKAADATEVSAAAEKIRGQSFQFSVQGITQWLTNRAVANGLENQAIQNSNELERVNKRLAMTQNELTIELQAAADAMNLTEDEAKKVKKAIDELAKIHAAYNEAVIKQGAKDLKDYTDMMRNAKNEMIEFWSEGMIGVDLDSIEEIIEPEEIVDDWLDGFKPFFDKFGGLFGPATKLVNRDLGELRGEFEKGFVAAGGDPLNQKEMERAWAEFLQMTEANAMESLDAMMMIGDALTDVFAGVTDGRIENLEREADALKEHYDLQRDLINQEVTDEESKKKRLADLEKEEALQNKIIQEKINKERKKQAILDRANALFQIAINTAVWASRVGAESGLGGFVTVPLVIAIGALQAAAVLAQPIPEFKEGHLAGTFSGVAKINDGGQIEVLERKGGGLEISSQKDKYVHMNKGDKVHKSIDSFLNQLPHSSVMESIHGASLLSAVNLSNSIMSQSPRETFDAAFKEAMLETMSKGLSSTRIVNDNTSVADAMREVMSENQFKSRLF